MVQYMLLRIRALASYIVWRANMLRSACVALRIACIALLFCIGLTIPLDAEIVRATFAGGCFWCIEQPFDETPGVLNTVVGFSGGEVADPSYDQVVQEDTGHLEVLQVTYDSEQVSYKELLDIFWRNVDPLDAGGQFCDRGRSYTTAIFFHNREQERAAGQSKEELDESERFNVPIVTPIRRFTVFYPAEAYHQNYYQKNPRRYKWYRQLCGRDARLKALWGEEAGGR